MSARVVVLFATYQYAKQVIEAARRLKGMFKSISPSAVFVRVGDTIGFVQISVLVSASFRFQFLDFILNTAIPPKSDGAKIKHTILSAGGWGSDFNLWGNLTWIAPESWSKHRELIQTIAENKLGYLVGVTPTTIDIPKFIQHFK